MRPIRVVVISLVALALSGCDLETTRAPSAPQLTEWLDAAAKYAPDAPPTILLRDGVGGSDVPRLSVSGTPSATAALSVSAAAPVAEPPLWASPIGRALTLMDDESANFGFGFTNFRFYLGTYSGGFIGANGNLTFNSMNFSKVPRLPEGRLAIAAPAYADWKFRPGSPNSVYINTLGQAPNRRFVVTWMEARPCCDATAGPTSTFQLVLVEGTNQIIFNYRAMDAVPSNALAGVSYIASVSRVGAGADLLALQGCSVTLTPNAAFDTYVQEKQCGVAQKPNEPPTSDAAGPYSAAEGAPVTFVGAGTDPENAPLSFKWSYGDGAYGTGAVTSHEYADNGSYTASLTVSDGELSATSRALVTITNVAPVITALGGGAVMSGDPFQLSAQFGDPGANDGPWQYVIEWGDGQRSRGSVATQAEAVSASHTYMEPKSYVVKLTVSDKDNGSGSREAEVVVNRHAVAIDVLPHHDPPVVSVSAASIDGDDDSDEDSDHEGPYNRRWLPVAVLSDNALPEVRMLDVGSVRVGTTPVAMKYGKKINVARMKMKDVDGDGDMDLLLYFDRRALVANGDLTPTTTVMRLTARLVNGRYVAGEDVIKTVR